MAERDYIIMMKDSLERKLDLLEQLQVKNRLQTAILKDPNSDPDELEANVEAKGRLIERLESLDEGFDSLYKRVAESLEANKEMYANDIHEMQDLIRKITDMSAQVEMLEKKNKEIAVSKFSTVRSQIKETNHSGKVVTNYYNNMMATNTMSPSFLDDKK